jgi:hypothetical protein
MILQKIRKSYKKKVATYLEDKMHLYILRFSRAFMHSKALQGHSCIQKPFKGIHAFKSPSRAFMYRKALQGHSCIQKPFKGIHAS